MARQTLQDYEIASERLEEALFLERGGSIKDRDTFDLAVVNTFGEITGKQKELFDRVFEIYAERRGITKERLFTKSGGKDFEKDKSHLAKIVVDDQKEYIRRGAQRVDLRGFDTPDRTRFPLEGKVKKKIVMIRQSQLTRRKKKVLIFRDSKGRFAKKI